MAPPLDGVEPDALGPLCVHLRHAPDDASTPASTYVLVEPRDPAAPALFRTSNWHIDAIAPRHGNDPISVPAFTALLRRLGALRQRLDTIPDEPLATYGRRIRPPRVEMLGDLPTGFTLVRIFGE